MTDSRSRCVVEISTDTRPIVYPTIDWLSTDCWPTIDRYIDRVSTDYRPLYPPIDWSTLPTVNVNKIRNLDDCYVDFEYILYKVITAKYCGSLYAVTFTLTLIPWQINVGQIHKYYTSGLWLGSITSRCSGKWARTHPSLRGGSKTGPGRWRKSSLVFDAHEPQPNNTIHVLYLYFILYPPT